MKNQAEAKAVQVVCPRCWGVKRFEVWSHIEKGLCFRCAGHGTIDYLVPGDFVEAPAYVKLAKENGEALTKEHAEIIAFIVDGNAAKIEKIAGGFALVRKTGGVVVRVRRLTSLVGWNEEQQAETYDIAA